MDSTPSGVVTSIYLPGVCSNDSQLNAPCQSGSSSKKALKPEEASHFKPSTGTWTASNQSTHLMSNPINCIRCLNAGSCLHTSNHQLLLPAILKQQCTPLSQEIISSWVFFWEVLMHAWKNKSWPLDYVWHFGGAFECTYITFSADGTRLQVSSVMKGEHICEEKILWRACPFHSVVSS